MLSEDACQRLSVFSELLSGLAVGGRGGAAAAADGVSSATTADGRSRMMFSDTDGGEEYDYLTSLGPVRFSYLYPHRSTPKPSVRLN